jgi:hypothetical protein
MLGHRVFTAPTAWLPYHLFFVGRLQVPHASAFCLRIFSSFLLTASRTRKVWMDKKPQMSGSDCVTF